MAEMPSYTNALLPSLPLASLALEEGDSALPHQLKQNRESRRRTQRQQLSKPRFECIWDSPKDADRSAITLLG